MARDMAKWLSRACHLIWYLFWWRWLHSFASKCWRLTVGVQYGTLVYRSISIYDSVRPSVAGILYLLLIWPCLKIQCRYNEESHVGPYEPWSKQTKLYVKPQSNHEASPCCERSRPLARKERGKRRRARRAPSAWLMRRVRKAFRSLFCWSSCDLFELVRPKLGFKA